MKISIFVGDLCDAPAEALCTSTNPRLSLAMGTGAAVRARGGYAILRSCEALVEAEYHRSGNRQLPAGSAHLTNAGELPAKAIIHCIASNARHQSSVGIIRSCVINALLRAEEAGCTTIALPVFASGHAAFRFDRSLSVMILELCAVRSRVEQAYVVFDDSERIESARRVIGEIIPGADPDVQRSIRSATNDRDTWLGEE